MKKKISLWIGAICLIALAAWAANPSFTSFDTSQFSATTANGVSVKRTGSFTNSTFVTFGGSAGVIARDYLGAGQILTVIDQNATTQFYVDLDGSVNVNSALNLTYATASTLLQANGSKKAVSLANGTGYLKDDGAGGFSWDNTVVTTATVPNPSWSTNGVSAAATFPVATNGVYSLTNAAGAVTFTAVSGTDSARVTWGTLLIDANGADRTLTLPASWRVPDGVRTITVTNGIVGVLSVNCYAQKYTNAFYRPLF